MNAKTIYCDEAGFTGSNLLDSAQPIFTIASTDLGEMEAEDILFDAFPRYRGSEFKFTNIWGSNNAAGLVRFGERFASLGDRA